MALDKHELFETLWSDVMGWIPPGMTMFDDLSKLVEDKSQSAVHRYQAASFIRCDNMVRVFVRLERVTDMTGRSIHRRKGEDKDEILNKWMVYHYGY